MRNCEQENFIVPESRNDAQLTSTTEILRLDYKWKINVDDMLLEG